MRWLLLLGLAASCYAPKIADGGFACSPDDLPACPEGFHCADGLCRAGAAPAPLDAAPVIPKSGAPYTGPHLDPVLDSPTDCPDAALEPDDSPATALLAPLGAPDQPSAKVTKVAICPTGPSPKTGHHDLDYYKVDTSGQGPLTLVASIDYDIRYGDLDLALVDRQGKVLATDGSALSNGCVAAALPPGVYYVVVAGARGTDVNRYEARMQLFSAPRACP